MQEWIQKEQEQDIKDKQIDELSRIVGRSRHTWRTSLAGRNSVYNYRATAQGQSNRQQYTMQMIPGSMKVAQERKRNYSIQEIAQKYENRSIDWKTANLLRDRLVVERFGSAVPLLFNLMILCIGVLGLMFFGNLYSVLRSLFDSEYRPSSSAGVIIQHGRTYSYACGGQCIFDYKSTQNQFVGASTFILWTVLSIWIRVMANQKSNMNFNENQQQDKEEEDDDDNEEEGEANHINKTEVILKYFDNNLDKEGVEQILMDKLNQCYMNMKIGTHIPLPKIELESVTPIIDSLKLLKPYKELNEAYMELIKAIYEVDRDLVAEEINKEDVIIENIENKQEQQEGMEEKEEFDICSNNTINQKSDAELKEQLLKISQEDVPKELDNLFTRNIFQDKNEDIKIVQENVISTNNNGENTLPHVEDHQIDFSKGNEDHNHEEEDEEEKQCQYQVISSNKLSQLSRESFQPNKILIEQDQEKLIQIPEPQVSIHNESTMITPDRIAKLLESKNVQKRITKYQSLKNSINHEILSTNSGQYILNCKDLAQKELVLMILQPPTVFVNLYQKCKYMFQKENDFHLERVEKWKLKGLDIQWSSMGLSMIKKFEREFFVRSLGFILFVGSAVTLSLLISFKNDNDQEDYKGAKYVAFKAFFALSQSLFYLINEKLYEWLAKGMESSQRSKTIILQMQDLFFFYSLSYIIAPLMNLFTIGATAFESYYSDKRKPLFQDIQFSPFDLFVYSSIFAIFLFSLKSYFYPKWVWRHLKQWYWSAKQRYTRLTQFECNKIYSREKFGLKQNMMYFSNVLIVTIPLTYCYPAAIILPLCFLIVQYFVFRYQYVNLFRPIYYHRSIYSQYCKKFFRYLQVTNFVSFLVFSEDPFTLFAGLFLWAVCLLAEFTIYVFYHQSNNPYIPTPITLLQVLDNNVKHTDQITMNNRLYQVIAALQKKQQIRESDKESKEFELIETVISKQNQVDTEPQGGINSSMQQQHQQHKQQSSIITRSNTHSLSKQNNRALSYKLQQSQFYLPAKSYSMQLRAQFQENIDKEQELAKANQPEQLKYLKQQIEMNKDSQQDENEQGQISFVFNNPLSYVASYSKYILNLADFKNFHYS